MDSMRVFKRWSFGILGLLLLASIFSAIATQIQSSQAAPPTSVQQYEQTPGAVKSPLQVAVNGQNIFVEQYKDVHYARFAFTGNAKVTVTPSTSASAYTISPRAYNITSTRAGNAISFTLNEPHKLILQFGNTKLFLFADPSEVGAPQPNDPNVINVSRYVNNTAGRTDQTANIQRALNDAAKTRGIVYFPKGTYLSGTLKMQSNMSAYLASGALIKGLSKVKGFSEGNFVVFEGVNHSKIFGRGVIDAGGKQLRTQGDDGRIKILRTIRASEIDIQDILLRDSGSWTVHLAGSDNVRIKNLKLINDMTSTNGDGIDPDASNNITVDGAFLYTTDDCFAVKTSGVFQTLQPSSNILIKNSVCYSKKSALKIGTETKANLNNITFDNNAVVHADRAISLYMADGSTMQNIFYRNNSAEVVGGDAKQRLVDINITKRKGVGNIRNVEISNFTAYNFSPKTSAITGLSGGTIDVKFIHLIVNGKVRTSAADAQITVNKAQVSFQP
jgi:hypothetical protein